MRPTDNFRTTGKWIPRPGQDVKTATHFVADLGRPCPEDQNGSRLFCCENMEDGAGGMSAKRVVTKEVYVKPSGDLFYRAIDDGSPDGTAGGEIGDSIMNVGTAHGGNRYLRKGFKYAQEADLLALWARGDAAIAERAAFNAARTPEARAAREGHASGTAMAAALVQAGMVISKPAAQKGA